MNGLSKVIGALATSRHIENSRAYEELGKMAAYVRRRGTAI
jgi:hypothetical protein